MNNLQARIISGIIAAIIALGLTIAHPMSFMLMLSAAFAIGWREWHRLNTQNTIGFLLFGAGYLSLPIICMIWLRLQPIPLNDGSIQGPHWILALFALVWTTDIAAYASGRLIGGPKIARSISPNKTWAGLLGAMAATAALAYMLAGYLPAISSVLALCGGAALALLAQCGDFYESWLKRRAGVKDSGTLMPGHGGLLDRIDGLLPASVVFAMFVYAISHA